ncbi:MAG: hypothetical protein WBG02_02435 [Candidatus Acidiferrum sp.]
MNCAQVCQKNRRSFLNCAAGVAAILFVAFPCQAQTAAAHPQAQAKQQNQGDLTQELNKYPGLLDEFGKLYVKLTDKVQLPAPRTESRLLPLLLPSTSFFAAFANYGDALHQSVAVFHEELKESNVLRDWWEHLNSTSTGTKLDDFLEQIAQLHQFLGDEIVVAGSAEGHENDLTILAEIKKPGLKKSLEQLLAKQPGMIAPGVRVLDAQELATAKEGPAHELLVLVRPDYVVATSDLAMLRSFNAHLDSKNSEFASTAFGKRVAKEYQGGVTILAAADLQKLINQAPVALRTNDAFQNSGFSDLKYAVWDHKMVAGQSLSQAELSFSAPRHGAAAWLANSGPLTNLDFVSPKAVIVFTVVLANPAQIFDDIKKTESMSKNDPFATLSAFERMLNLSLRDDLLKNLSGELTIEVDKIAAADSVWRVVFKLNDAAHVQQTLGTLLTAAHMEARHIVLGGVSYYAVRVPSQATPMEIGYAFVDGHLILGSSLEVVAESIQMHRSGGSLAKSQQFLASLPPGHGLEASALLYEDPAAMTAHTFEQMSPELAAAISQIQKNATPMVAELYGEDSAIRGASRSGALDAGTVMVVAAIAIPNLLRSRMAANEASAVGSLRSVNTAQAAYASSYPEKGYASDLAKLGVNPQNSQAHSADHAGFLDATLANEGCAASGWCTKSGYRFTVRSACKLEKCGDFVAFATPVDSNTGVRSFCATSDGVIRHKTGLPIAMSLSVEQCKEWQLLQ